MKTRRPNEIKTHPTFELLFPINPALLEKIEQDMRDGNVRRFTTNHSGHMARTNRTRLHRRPHETAGRHKCGH